MIEITLQKRKSFQTKVLAWYGKNKRDLPWRKTREPYAILISEVMLQQTQVSRVLDYYHRFLKRFPNWGVLARARKHTLLKYWSGLGYNNRVLRLQKCAKEVQGSYGGSFPKRMEEIVTLPGIGPYTAGAILSFAFNKRVPVIDTNIRRVLISNFNLPSDTREADLEELALSLVPQGKSRIWHNALMDYGALVVTARATGIKPLSKQSPFKNSDRWVRGSIIKLLLKQKSIQISKLKEQFDPDQLNVVVKKMAAEGLLVKTGGQIKIA